MSKFLKILILLATLWPLLYIGLFIAFFIFTMSFAAQGGHNISGGPPPVFIVIFGLHIFTMVWDVGLMIFYIVHVFRTKAIRETMKILWTIVLIFGGPIAMPIYWYLYIWREPPPVNPVENTAV